MKTKCIYQSQAKGCGYAAIKMALIHSSGRKDFAYAPEPLISYKAPSIADLVIYGESFGLSLQAYRVADPSELSRNTEYPLLLVTRENRMTHMVYLLRKSRRYYYFLDPAKGKRRLRHQELHSIFTGAFLCERGYCEKKETVYKKKEAIGKKHKILDALLSIFPSLFLIAGLFCLEKAPIWLGISFIGFSLVSLAVGKIVKLREFKKFDRVYGSRLLVEEEEKRVELYTRFCAYKGLAFTSVGAFLTSFLEIALISGMFVAQDLSSTGSPYFSLALVLALLCGIFVNILDEPREKEAMVAAEEKEKAFLYGKMGKKKREVALLSLFASSSSFAGILLSKEAFYLGISIALSAITMVATLRFDFASFVYYCLGIALLLRCLSSCFEAADKIERKKKEEPFFLFHFCREGIGNE